MFRAILVKTIKFTSGNKVMTIDEDEVVTVKAFDERFIGCHDHKYFDILEEEYVKLLGPINETTH